MPLLPPDLDVPPRPESFFLPPTTKDMYYTQPCNACASSLDPPPQVVDPFCLGSPEARGPARFDHKIGMLAQPWSLRRLSPSRVRKWRILRVSQTV